MATQVTGSLPNNFTPVPPNLKDLLDLWAQNLMTVFNCHHIGTVEAFNSATQTATVSLNYQKTSFVLNQLTQQYENQLQDYPLITECPVVILGGGLAHLTFPIAPGDECLLLFNDRDIDNWFGGSNTAGVNTPRLHSFSDAICLVGLNSLAYTLQSYDTTRAVLGNGTALVGVGPNLIKIANGLYTLNGLLQNLITALQTLVIQTASITVSSGAFVAGVTPVTGISGPPVNAAAISAVAMQLMTTATELSALLE